MTNSCSLSNSSSYTIRDLPHHILIKCHPGLLSTHGDQHTGAILTTNTANAMTHKHGRDKYRCRIGLRQCQGNEHTNHE